MLLLTSNTKGRDVFLICSVILAFLEGPQRSSFKKKRFDHWFFKQYGKVLIKELTFQPHGKVKKIKISVHNNYY